MFDYFLCVPYTDHDKDVVDERAKEAEKFIATATAALQGLIVYSPVAMYHHLVDKYDLPIDHDYWNEHCAKTMAMCKEVIVLEIHGWKHSKGVKTEIEFADVLHKKINYVGSHRTLVKDFFKDIS